MAEPTAISPEEMEKNTLFILEEMLKMEKVDDNLWKDRLGYATINRETTHTLPKSGITAYTINWLTKEQGKTMDKTTVDAPKVDTPVALPAPEGDVVATPAETTPV